MHAPDLAEGGVDAAAMIDLARRHRPALVAATHIPINSGLVQPVAEIGRACRELDLLYLVDACQSAGSCRSTSRRSAATSSPRRRASSSAARRGSGLLYVSDRVLRSDREPLFIDMYGARWTSAAEYEPLASAARFEDWEFSYATVLGCATAIRYALGVGVAAGGVRAAGG